ncbi:SAMHD1 [Mytilus edulis]|uniref:SAMHD1 n=1 Tax=Mytilus edulis TaxID=6550 RepID=A0A8S3UZM9_MYTED|nr:SAMHD1 [Mytilus edulis]
MNTRSVPEIRKQKHFTVCFKLEQRYIGRAYQHRVCDAIEAMVLDAFLAADHIGIIPGKDGIIHVILMSSDKNLEKSRNILQRIMHRQLYACVGETTPIEGDTFEESSQIKDEIVSNIPPKLQSELLSDDLYVDLVYLDYGSKSKNPMSNVRFYNKKDVTKPVRIDKNQVSLMLPNVFAEQIVRLYCKKSDNESLKIASDCFRKWCQDNNLLLHIKVSEEVLGMTTTENLRYPKEENFYLSLTSKERHDICVGLTDIWAADIVEIIANQFLDTSQYWFVPFPLVSVTWVTIPQRLNFTKHAKPCKTIALRLLLINSNNLASHNGVGFSTFDNDNDVSIYYNAEEWHGGCWYRSNEINCNLHGKYIFGEADHLGEGLFWRTWKENFKSLKSTTMIIRRL